MTDSQVEDKRRHHPLVSILFGTLSAVLPLAVLAAAVAGAVWFVRTKPQPQRRARDEQAAVVEIVKLQATSQPVVVAATGTVVPARQVVLTPRVAGPIVERADKLVPGGQFAAGDRLFQIDPTDYELALAARQSELAQAEYEYKSEQGRQEVALDEWQRLGQPEEASELERELVLRQPQLRAAQARLAAAEAALQRARLDLQRTAIEAPFNLMIRQRHAEVGTQATTQTPLVEVVGTDEYWVEATLPVRELRWVQFPDGDRPGSPVELSSGAATSDKLTWQGAVLARRPDLERSGRLAQVIVAVPRPLAQNAQLPLLVGSFVRVAIGGPQIADVFAIPRRAVREGGQVWLLNDASRLEIRALEWVWSDDRHVFVASGLADGDRLVVSDLATPVPGMLLDVTGDTAVKSDPLPAAGRDD